MDPEPDVAAGMPQVSPAEDVLVMRLLLLTLAEVIIVLELEDGRLLPDCCTPNCWRMMFTSLSVVVVA
jgi:hypothetical protein